MTTAAGSAPAPAPAPDEVDAARHADVERALACHLVAPAALGLWLRGGPGPRRDACLDVLAEHARAAGHDALLRLPPHISDDRLLGGLDLTATLERGRPVVARGLLAEADGRDVLATMAERMEPATVARLVAVIDAGAVDVQREGVEDRTATRFGLVALDEGEGDETIAASLADRLALPVDLTPLVPTGGHPVSYDVPDAAVVAAARDRLESVDAADEHVEALCALAVSLGIDSLRAPRHALLVARVLASLDGRGAVEPVDVGGAARLVLAPRATRWPESRDDQEQSEEEPPPEPPEPPEPEEDDTAESGERELDADTELLVEALQAALPPDLLKGAGERTRARGDRSGRVGAEQETRGRGRPAGVRIGPPRSGERLALLETLRAAAPWQRLRPAPPAPARIAVRRDDFRTQRTRRHVPNVTLLVVDASGSAAAQRLAEAKGAVERLLGEAYARRDEVALLAFRGRTAELLLPPTRALARARRALAGLPGGGGTPLAAALHAVRELALSCRGRGTAPFVVLLTDGRANVTLDGIGDRARAGEEALTAARGLVVDGIGAVVVDTSRRGESEAVALAQACGADYRRLPVTDAAALVDTVRASRDGAGA